jgi:putative acetyltransferase
LESHVIIRNEVESDIPVIAEVTEAAFKTCPYGDHTEQFIINAMRAAGALTVSLVAEIDGEVVGHVAFSPVTAADGSAHWYGLGPVSVLPKHQRQGIGKALIREGLSLLEARGAKGCVLVGDPAYYRRLGFRNAPALTVEGVPPENVLALSFGESMPSGAVTFDSAFSARS